MGTQQIYEELLFVECLNRIKYLRNQWIECYAGDIRSYSPLIDFGGEVHQQYEIIVGWCRDTVIEMLNQVVKKLLKEYKIPIKEYYLDGRLAFSRMDKCQDVLFVFQDAGIQNRVQKDSLDKLMQAEKLERCCHISYAEIKDDHNVNEDKTIDYNPLKDTYTIKAFIMEFFGEEEYSVFKKYTDQLPEKIQDYLGFTVVRTLNPVALFSFKKYVHDDLTGIDATKIGAGAIKETQRQIIEKHFFEEKNYEVLLGRENFAQSYMTAEWLYASLKHAGNIDLTVIAMGYYKAIEQFLFCFIKNHTKEKDNRRNRIVYVGKCDYADTRGMAQVTDELMLNKEKSSKLTLAGLSGFFGYHHKDKNNDYYDRRNADLLNKGIDTDTHNFIIDTLEGITGLRNGYFHKDNITIEKEKREKIVDESRQKAILVFYLMLGAYSISMEDKKGLGLTKTKEHDGFYKLCEYVNRESFNHSQAIIPILYVNDISDPYTFVYPHQDEYVEYNEYGEVEDLRLCYKENGRIVRLNREHMPNEVWEGAGRCYKDTTDGSWRVVPTGEIKKIFSNGEFLVESVDGQ